MSQLSLFPGLPRCPPPTQALSEGAQRRELIAILRKAGLTVDGIAEVVAIEPRRVFRHLAILRKAGDPRATYRPRCPSRFRLAEVA